MTEVHNIIENNSATAELTYDRDNDAHLFLFDTFNLEYLVNKEFIVHDPNPANALPLNQESLELAKENLDLFKFRAICAGILRDNFVNRISLTAGLESTDTIRLHVDVHYAIKRIKVSISGADEQTSRKHLQFFLESLGFPNSLKAQLGYKIIKSDLQPNWHRP